MELKKMSKEEIELMSYTDLTYIILKDNKKSMNTASLFRKICDLLELSDEEYSTKIGDYYTSLTIDKRFYLLENAEWDLVEKYKVKLILDDEEEESLDEDLDSMDEEDENDVSEESEDDLDSIDSIDDDIDDVDDDTLDLSIVTEEELEEEN